ITLDLRNAKNITLPEEAKSRRTGKTPKDGAENPVRDDLEGLWAGAQVAYFVRAAPIEGFGFPAFAARATATKYNVPKPPGDPVARAGTKLVPYSVTRMVQSTVEGRTVVKPVTETHYKEVSISGDSENDGWGRLYEMTTGAAAIAESLALRRMAG